MEELFIKHWQIIPGLIIGGFVTGVVSMHYVRRNLREWVLNDSGSIIVCPLVEKGQTAISREEHEEACSKRWDELEKIRDDQWKHHNELTAIGRENLMIEIGHVKETVDKIYRKLEKNGRV